MSVAGCHSAFAGRLFSDPCDECGHVLAIHRPEDKVCAACEGLAQILASNAVSGEGASL